MVKLRVAVRVIPENSYLTNVDAPAATYLIGERRFPVIVRDPEQWYIGTLALEVKKRYQSLYKHELGQIKYLKDNVDDCDLDPEQLVWDLLIDEGKAAQDATDQHVTIKVIQEQGHALRAGSVIPDLTPVHFQPRSRPPVPIFSQIQPPFGKRASNQDSNGNESDNGFGPKRQRLAEIQETQEDRLVASIETDAAEYRAHGQRNRRFGSPDVIKESQKSATVIKPGLANNIVPSTRTDTREHESGSEDSEIAEIGLSTGPAEGSELPNDREQIVLGATSRHRLLAGAVSSDLRQAKSLSRSSSVYFSPVHASGNDSAGEGSTSVLAPWPFANSLATNGQTVPKRFSLKRKVESRPPITPPSDVLRKDASTGQQFSSCSSLKSKSPSVRASSTSSRKFKPHPLIGNNDLVSDIDDSQMSPRSKNSKIQQPSKIVKRAGRKSPQLGKAGDSLRGEQALVGTDANGLGDSGIRTRNENIYDSSDNFPQLGHTGAHVRERESSAIDQASKIEDEAENSDTQLSEEPSNPNSAVLTDIVAQVPGEKQKGSEHVWSSRQKATRNVQSNNGLKGDPNKTLVRKKPPSTTNFSAQSTNSQLSDAIIAVSSSQVSRKSAAENASTTNDLNESQATPSSQTTQKSLRRRRARKRKSSVGNDPSEENNATPLSRGKTDVDELPDTTPTRSQPFRVDIQTTPQDVPRDTPTLDSPGEQLTDELQASAQKPVYAQSFIDTSPRPTVQQKKSATTREANDQPKAAPRAPKGKNARVGQAGASNSKSTYDISTNDPAGGKLGKPKERKMPINQKSSELDNNAVDHALKSKSQERSESTPTESATRATNVFLPPGMTLEEYEEKKKAFVGVTQEEYKKMKKAMWNPPAKKTSSRKPSLQEARATLSEETRSRKAVSPEVTQKEREVKALGGKNPSVNGAAKVKPKISPSVGSSAVVPNSEPKPKTSLPNEVIQKKTSTLPKKQSSEPSSKAAVETPAASQTGSVTNSHLRQLRAKLDAEKESFNKSKAKESATNTNSIKSTFEEDDDDDDDESTESESDVETPSNKKLATLAVAKPDPTIRDTTPSSDEEDDDD